MCDAMSLGSAFSSVMAGSARKSMANAQAIDASSRGQFAQAMGELQATQYLTQANFDAIMFESASLLADQKASADQAALIRDFEEQAKQNMAAMAVAGLSQESFAAIMDGNDAELRRASKEIEKNANSQKDRDKARADMARSSGQKNAEMARISGNIQNIDAQFESFAKRVEGKIAMYTGIGNGLATLYKAETDFQDNRLPDQSRFDYFKKSVGMS